MPIKNESTMGSRPWYLLLFDGVLRSQNKHLWCLILIFLLAFFLRFYRLNERYQVFADMARDVLVAREAVKLGISHWPIVGSFSSTGPFVFGPLFYWLVSLVYLPNVNWLIMPWLLTALVSVIFIWIMAEAGRELSGKRLALFCALLAAVSPAQVLRSEALTQHTYVAISSAVTLLTFIIYLKNRSAKSLFIMGLAIGFGLSMHYQAINLLPFALAPILATRLKFLPKRKKVIKPFIGKLIKLFKDLLALSTGLLIPSLPLLIWDSQQEWANFRNILDYLFIGQYRIYVPNRWLTYLTQFWPEFWGSLVGGLAIFGWLFAFLAAIFLLKTLVERKLSKTMFWLILIFLFQFVLLRYHRGERFEGYLIYFHPLIILFSAWTLELLSRKFFLPVIIILITATFFSLKIDLRHVLTTQNQTPQLKAVVNDLKEQYPGKKFNLYDYQFASASHSFGISLFLDQGRLIDTNNGIPLGVCLLSCPENLQIISEAYRPTKVIDLSSLSKNELKKPTWNAVGPRAVYEDVTLWWQKEKLKSPFSLQKFIFGKLGLEKKAK